MHRVRAFPLQNSPSFGAMLALLLVLPLWVLGAALLLGAKAALICALVIPLAQALGFWGLTRAKAQRPAATRDPVTGLPSRMDMEALITARLDAAHPSEMTTACIVMDIDGFHAFNDRWGRAAGDELLRQCAERLQSVLRPEDYLCRLEADAFAVFLAPSPGLNFDAILSVTERLQVALADPVLIGGVSSYCSACAGIALRRHVRPGDMSIGEAMLRAADRAMVEARGTGPAAYQVYSAKMHAIARASHSLADEVTTALERGEINAWFQPQVSSDGTKVTGMEALARWHHPEKGPIPPVAFLPAIEAAGRSERLSDTMLANALTALRDWDTAGIHVPQVGVNFAANELRSPRLVEKVTWELDRFGLTPERLAVEVLETVVSQGDDDLLLRNLAQLRDLGCRIELDDFGTGAAAITSIRRFGVTRIKIDRSFVTHLDKDPDQARLCQAIVTLAGQLEIDVLAEGVETLSEQACLHQMGCAHVQGFGIARPMPGPDALAWLIDHQHRQAAARQAKHTSGQFETGRRTQDHSAHKKIPFLPKTVEPAHDPKLARTDSTAAQGTDQQNVEPSQKTAH
ncbi:MAG: diguanylate cyclase (GGDEF)-like protein [Sulfitobacter sp.]|jgi:diguanylate cyclase (GGDEF)-like protein